MISISQREHNDSNISRDPVRCPEKFYRKHKIVKNFNNSSKLITIVKSNMIVVMIMIVTTRTLVIMI